SAVSVTKYFLTMLGLPARGGESATATRMTASTRQFKPDGALVGPRHKLIDLLHPALCHQRADGQPDKTVLKRYVWGLDLSQSLHAAGGIGGLLGCVDTAGTAATGDDRSFIYAYDGQGNVTQLIETTVDPLTNTPGPNYGTVAASYAYDAFGSITSQSGNYAEANPFRFSTKYFDAETGLSYYGYRYYSARLGRWLSRDPIGEAGGVNLYAFVENSPPNLFEPFGLFPQDAGVFGAQFDCNPNDPTPWESIWSGQDLSRLLNCDPGAPTGTDAFDAVLNDVSGGLQIAGGTALAGTSAYATVCALSGPPGWAVAAGSLAIAGACVAADQIGAGYVQIEQGTHVPTQLNNDILQGKCGLSRTQAAWAELGVNLGLGGGQLVSGVKCVARATPVLTGNCLTAEQALACAADESFDFAASIPSVRNPRACSVGVSTRTGQSYRGVSGEFTEPCGTQLGGRLPTVSVEKHSVTRCAEVSVAARAEAAGECLDDLFYSTRSVRTGEIMDPCGNCRSWIAPGRCLRGTEAP
ncbi:MAG: RHS repeat-associated core domain-containing protein, partial [Phycisphaerae bacterium]